MLTAGEDHSCNPEEDDIVTCYENICGVEVLKVFCVFGPAQCGEGPESGGKPCVKNVGITLDVFGVAVFTLCCILAGNCCVTAVSTVPSGNLVTPPELTGDTPVTYVVHPVEVCLGETVGNELYFAVFNNADSFLCKGLHLNEPLCRCDRLNICAAAVASADVVTVLFNLYKVACLVEVSYDLLSCFVAVETVVLAAVYYLSVVIKNKNLLKTVALTNFEVVGVVAGSHLYAACTELCVNIFVCDDGNFTTNKGKNTCLADEVCVTLVIGVYANACIAQHCLGTGSCNDNPFVAVLYGVAQMPQMTGLFCVLNFSIGQSSCTVGTPVDNTVALVDKTLFVKAYEYFTNSLCALVVHCKAETAPVAGSAHCLKLGENTAAVLLFPLPNAVEELFTAKVKTCKTFFAKLFFNLDLCCNTCMVCAGKPQSSKAFHSLIADKCILNCVVKGMS